jgi:predicted transcriptional regulator
VGKFSQESLQKLAKEDQDMAKVMSYLINEVARHISEETVLDFEQARETLERMLDKGIVVICYNEKDGAIYLDKRTEAASE